MVEAASDHGWYWDESCSGMKLAVMTGPQDSVTKRSLIFVCVETVKEESGIESL